VHETLLALILHRGKKADAWRVEGGSDPTKLLGGLAAKKWGPPARLGVFSTVTFACAGSLSPTPQRNCSRHRLKNSEKTKLKCVVLTFFIFPRRFLLRNRNPAEHSSGAAGHTLIVRSIGSASTFGFGSGSEPSSSTQEGQTVDRSGTAPSSPQGRLKKNPPLTY
jgi:hypothetical protein